MGDAKKWEAMTGRELRRIMEDWPSVMRQATDDWAKTFAADIWKLSGNGQWRPTAKQAKNMRRMIRELCRETDEVILVE